jgi:mRNA interferase RelE/StbE
MLEKRFDVRLHPDAIKEYNKLDNSVIKIVNKSIDELEYRADEIGKKLSNSKNTKLAGCKEMKLRDSGIKIIFRVTSEVVEILKVVYIYTIEKRRDEIVFKVADKRNKTFKKLNKKDLLEYLDKSQKWYEDS